MGCLVGFGCLGNKTILSLIIIGIIPRIKNRFSVRGQLEHINGFSDRIVWFFYELLLIVHCRRAGVVFCSNGAPRMLYVQVSRTAVRKERVRWIDFTAYAYVIMRKWGSRCRESRSFNVQRSDTRSRWNGTNFLSIFRTFDDRRRTTRRGTCCNYNVRSAFDYITIILHDYYVCMAVRVSPDSTREMSNTIHSVTSRW